MRQSTVRHVPALDGLRAAALIAVLLDHGNVTWAKGGYFGMDAFFVLSGFLITRLLLAEWREHEGINLKAFWARRARRLLPALAVMLLGVAAYAAFAASPVELTQLRHDALATMAYVANWNQIFSHQSYFQQFGPPSALLHTWSLAIEEQFYLVWPIMLLLALKWKRMTKRMLLIGIAFLAVASAAWMAVLFQPGTDPSRVYYGTDTRAQSLLVGAFVAVLLGSSQGIASPKWRRAIQVAAIGAVGILLVLCATADSNSTWVYRGGFLLTASLTAIVIASVCDPSDTGIIGWLLSARWLCFIGLVSYGVYLWHWPVYVYLSPERTGLPHLQLLVVRLAVSFAIAIASYYFVEQPIRRGGLRGWRERLLTPVVAGGLVAVLIAGTAGAATSEFGPASVADIKPPTVVKETSATHRRLRVMVVGDSVAASMAPGMQAEANALGFDFWDVAVPGCGIANDVGERWFKGWEGPQSQCTPGWRTRWPLQVAQFNPDIVVMLIGYQESFDRRINGQVIRFDTPAGALLAQSEEQEAIKVLSARGARVVLLSTPDYVIGWPLIITLSRSPYNQSWIEAYNTIQRRIVAQSKGKVVMFDLNKLLDPDGVWTPTVNGIAVRSFDKVHLSAVGSTFVAQWLAPRLKKLKTRPH